MNDNGFKAGLISGIILSVLIFILYELFAWRLTWNEPQAIDVYRGKTTLQITYKDSIPQDTIVVFK